MQDRKQPFSADVVGEPPTRIDIPVLTVRRRLLARVRVAVGGLNIKLMLLLLSLPVLGFFLLMAFGGREIADAVRLWMVLYVFALLYLLLGGLAIAVTGRWHAAREFGVVWVVLYAVSNLVAALA